MGENRKHRARFFPPKDFLVYLFKYIFGSPDTIQKRSLFFPGTIFFGQNLVFQQ